MRIPAEVVSPYINEGDNKAFAEDKKAGPIENPARLRATLPHSSQEPRQAVDEGKPAVQDEGREAFHRFATGVVIGPSARSGGWMIAARNRFRYCSTLALRGVAGPAPILRPSISGSDLPIPLCRYSGTQLRR